MLLVLMVMKLQYFKTITYIRKINKKKDEKIINITCDVSSAHFMWRRNN